MNDVLMLIVLAVILVCLFSLFISVRRMAAGDSRRIRRCRQVTAMLVLTAAALTMGSGRMLAGYRFLMESELLADLRQTVLSRRNYEVQYVLLYFLLSNLLLLAAAWLVLLLLERLSDRGEPRGFRTMALYQKLLHLPWFLAWLCYEERDSGESSPDDILKPWAAVLGKWLWNLSDALLVLTAAEAVLGAAALYVRLPWLQGQEGAQVLCAWYLLPAALWLVTVQAAGFLEYCPKERADRERPAAESVSPEEKRLQSSLAAGMNAAVTKTAAEWFWPLLAEYLPECFQKRRRVVIICADESEAACRKQELTQRLSLQYDCTCLPRLGGAAQIQHRQDTDIVLTTAEELVALEPERVYPFWYQQAGTVIITDTHRLLSRTGREADMVFAVWNNRKAPVQYLFLGCSGSRQERQALEYYAQGPVECCGEPDLTDVQLVPWCVDSPRGRFRRLLLDMLQEDGVTEEWLRRQMAGFGMEQLGTEEFLTAVLSALFPEYRVQNIYDLFLFREEPYRLQGRWRIRLADAGIIERLKGGPGGEPKTEEEEFPASFQSVLYPDRHYRLYNMMPLYSTVRQGGKALQLYQAEVEECMLGCLSVPEDNGVPDYTRASYAEYRSTPAVQDRNERRAEGILVLFLQIPCGKEEDRSFLETLLAAVCQEVCREVFPYNKGELVACRPADMEAEPEGLKQEYSLRRIVSRAALEEQQKTEGLCVCLLEHSRQEHGLAAVLRRNSREYLSTCAGWLKRAAEKPDSGEAALLNGLCGGEAGREKGLAGAVRLLELLG